MSLKIQLPRPLGPHRLGVMDFELIDGNREESFAPGMPRRIPVRAWYPTRVKEGVPRPYAKPLELLHQIRACASRFGLSEDVVQAFDIPTYAVEDAPVAAGERHPVLVFSHGGGMYLQSNTALMEHLASYGYIVLSISHPYLAAATMHANGDIVSFDEPLFEAALANGARPEYLAAFTATDPGERLERQLANAHEAVLAPHFLIWEQDFLHVIDRLHSGELPPTARALLAASDLERLGVLGMSFGASGSAAAQRDDRIRSAVNLDGGIFDPALFDAKSRVPILVMHSDFSLLVPGVRTRPHSEFCYEALTRVGLRSDVIRLEVKGASHLAFTDLCLVPKELRTDKAAVQAILGSIDGGRMSQLVSAFVRHFFDQTLSGAGSAFSLEFRRDYPEVLDVELGDLRAWAATNPEPMFMSYRHVQIMNQRLGADSASRAECTKLERMYTVAYELAKGPEGGKVQWAMTFDPVDGVSFRLNQPSDGADLIYRGEWAATICAMREMKAGRAVALPLMASGNEEVLARLGGAFAAARAAATVPAKFPNA